MKMQDLINVTIPFSVSSGTILYHSTSEKYSTFADVPTWFTPSIKEAKGYHDNSLRDHGISITYKCQFIDGKIASPEQALVYAMKIWPDEEELMYSMFDVNVNEYADKDIKSFISLLEKDGYVGAIHSDYSSIDVSKDVFTLVLFHPNANVRIIDEENSTINKQQYSIGDEVYALNTFNQRIKGVISDIHDSIITVVYKQLNVSEKRFVDVSIDIDLSSPRSEFVDKA